MSAVGETLRMPAAGQVWRHYKIGPDSLYTIVGTGIDTVTGNAVVIYQHFEDDSGLLFSRPLNVFLGFTEHHKRRFTFDRPAFAKVKP